MKNKFLFSVFVYFIISVLIGLGSWQLFRLNWKLDLITEIENSLKNNPIELSIAKSNSGLSNKKWDKTIKSLTKNKLVSVKKIDDKIRVNISNYQSNQNNEDNKTLPTILPYINFYSGKENISIFNCLN